MPLDSRRTLRRDKAAGVWSAPGSDDDLLRPTLDERHDATFTGTAYDPRSLWIASFFGGAFAAAILFAFNANRLGQRRRALVHGVVFSGLGLVLTVLVVLGVAQGSALGVELRSEGFVDDVMRVLRPASGILGVLLGAIGYLGQRQRFRLYLHEERKPGAALVPAIVAIVLAVGISLGAASIGGAVLGRAV